MNPVDIILDSPYTYSRKRLVEISSALQRLEKRSKKYLKEFEQSEDWRRYKEGFLHLNTYVRPDDIVDLKTCDLSDREIAFYKPEDKKIIICSNKIEDKEHFNKTLLYNLTMMYDNTRANIDWNSCNQLSCMLVRSLNLSETCRADDISCFRKYLRGILYSKDVCKGREADCFENSYRACIKDIAPINTLKVSKTESLLK